MKIIMTIVLLAFVAMLSGCAYTSATTKSTTAADTGSLTDRFTADVTQAIADAKASTDPMAPQRVKCYTTLLSLIPQLPNVSAQHHAPAGIVDAFELTAERVEDVSTLAEYQMPTSVRIALLTDCGPLEARANDLLVLFNLKLVSVAGSAALLPK